MSGRDVNVYSSKPFFSVRWNFPHGGKGGGVCGIYGLSLKNYSKILLLQSARIRAIYE